MVRPTSQRAYKLLHRAVPQLSCQQWGLIVSQLSLLSHLVLSTKASLQEWGPNPP